MDSKKEQAELEFSTFELLCESPFSGVERDCILSEIEASRNRMALSAINQKSEKVSRQSMAYFLMDNDYLLEILLKQPNRDHLTSLIEEARAKLTAELGKNKEMEILASEMM